MSDRLAPRDADLLRRAERRWLEQARDRLRRPERRLHPDTISPAHAEETDR